MRASDLGDGVFAHGAQEGLLAEDIRTRQSTSLSKKKGDFRHRTLLAGQTKGSFELIQNIAIDFITTSRRYIKAIRQRKCHPSASFNVCMSKTLCVRTKLNFLDAAKNSLSHYDIFAKRE